MTQLPAWWQIILLCLPAMLNMWGIWHSFGSRFPGQSERMLWMALCVFLPLLGGLIYLLFGFRRAVREPKGRGE